MARWLTQARQVQASLLRGVVDRFREQFGKLHADEIIEARLSDCIHYYGFRNGVGGFHPYERYMQRRLAGDPVEPTRAEFVRFLQHYRPRDLAEALGIPPLSRPYGLGVFPWDGCSPHQAAQSGWFDEPDDVPDIMTYFWSRGISSTRIEEEFDWLEGALQSMRAEGYRPHNRSYIRVRTLIGRSGELRHLILDGNHRAAALAVLGQASIPVRRRSADIVREAQCARWTGVASGIYTEDDALRIFRALFARGDAFATVSQPAAVIHAGLRLAEIARRKGIVL